MTLPLPLTSWHTAEHVDGMVKIVDAHGNTVALVARAYASLVVHAPRFYQDAVLDMGDMMAIHDAVDRCCESGADTEFVTGLLRVVRDRKRRLLTEATE